MKAVREEALYSKVYEYNLSNVITNFEQKTPGIMGLHVINNPNYDPVNVDHRTTVRLNNANAAQIPLYPGLVIRAAIESFWINNTIFTSAIAQDHTLRLGAFHFDSWGIGGDRDPSHDALQFSVIDQAIVATGRLEYQIPTYGFAFLTLTYQDDITTVIPKHVGLKFLKYADVLRTKLMYTSVYMTRVFDYRRFQLTIPVFGVDQIQMAIRNFSAATACDASINFTFHN